MPIGEIDPVIYGSLPGYIVSGYQTSSTTLSSGGVNAGDAQEFYIIEQGLDIDYVRKRNFYWDVETSSYALSGPATISLTQLATGGTTLYCKVKAYSRGYRAFLNFSGQYVQNQLFAVYPNQSDVYGQSYGTVSSGSGTLSSIKLGPGGIIRTIQPGYQRYFWSALSGGMSSYYPASGWNESIEAYNFAISLEDCWPKVITLTSGTSSIYGGSTVPIISGISMNIYTGAPNGGMQLFKEAQLFPNPMYTAWPSQYGQGPTLTQNKLSPESYVPFNSMWGSYAASNEPNVAARTFINDVANSIISPAVGTNTPTYPYSLLQKVCRLYNSSNYWNPEIQLAFGVPSGKYDTRAIAAPVMTKYRPYLHST